MGTGLPPKATWAGRSLHRAGSTDSTLGLRPPRLQGLPSVLSEDLLLQGQGHGHRERRTWPQRSPGLWPMTPAPSAQLSSSREAGQRGFCGHLGTQASQSSGDLPQGTLQPCPHPQSSLLVPKPLAVLPRCTCSPAPDSAAGSLPAYTGQKSPQVTALYPGKGHRAA